MIEKIQIGDKWYVSATSSPADERTRVLKHNETFALFDRYGDIQSIGLGEEGIYHQDTRFLSHQELLINGIRPMFLSSTVKDNNSLLIVQLMNPDIVSEANAPISKGMLHVFRAKLLWNTACFEHVRVVNHGMEPVSVTISLMFEADYADIFEVRGIKRFKRGEYLTAQPRDGELLLGYRGLDGILRRTRITFVPSPSKILANEIQFDLDLQPKGETHVYATITCEIEGQAANNPPSYYDALKLCDEKAESGLSTHCRIITSNDLFNRWIDRSASDLIMLTTALPEGPYPYAGVPWYSTQFGRDGILTAREYLWIDPSLAKGVLSFLAATQATEEDPNRDAEPGKILHEARKGEMALMNEVPFRRYYGTVDATPLFIGLAGAYYDRTGDLEYVRTIWPNIKMALSWIDRYGDMDGDGFVEYARRSREGLEQQGWKDSRDSIFHRDGELAHAPIALCEVQGYVYEAKLKAAHLARLLGDEALARKLEDAACFLKQRFNDAFWCEDIGTFAIALDGNKRRCEVPSSNAGHTLWTGIATHDHAYKIANGLLSNEFFCGWGIRTIPSDVVRYNPMAYHNGSVWPHDNALIASGMASYGFIDQALTVLEGLFEASVFVDQHRLPELFCGFEKRPAEGPTLYPVACSPQGWAAASVFYLLQACLGLSFHPEKSEIEFRHPRLPPFLETVEINNLSINGASVNLLLQRYPNNVGINVVRKVGNIKVVVVA
ncbi:MAG: amylo-alpha-1,6-glucosidase [Pseudomonadota bacterium]